jgi:hypothetical protein
MNCSLDTVRNLILGAIAALLAAIALAGFWMTALPLFAAAALVASVSFYFIPAIRKALVEYARCRGPSDKCTVANTINTLGQAAAILSVVSFALAGAMQIAALALIATWLLAWLGLTIQAAVAILVTTGVAACATVVFVLIGVLSNAYSFKSCMDQQGGNTGPAGPGSGGVIFR